MLNGQIIEEWEGTHLSEDLRTKIVQLLTWDGLVPSFPTVGRTAFLALPVPLPVYESEERVIRSLKIKGVGLRDYFGVISPPSIVPYYRANLHLGFDEIGRSISVASEPSPLGGMTLLRARAEFECSKTLFELGCPAELPIALAIYPDLEFSSTDIASSKLGAVICGLPVEFPARLDALLIYDRCNNNLVTNLINDLRLSSHYELLHYIYTKLGTTLRKFHQSGFYRYSGHPGNFIFDPESQDVILVDLDSSQNLIKALMGTRRLYIARDLASAIYHLGAYILRSDNIAFWDYSTEQSVDLMMQVVHGYFPELDNSFASYFRKEYLITYSQAVNIAPKRHALASRKKKPPITAYQAYRTSELHHYWVNREEHFTKLMSLLTPLFSNN